MDKKTLSFGLIVLSLIAAVLATIDFISKTNEWAPLGLGADSWLGVAIVLTVYAIYVKQS
ncbi:MAG: hypothetical protein A2113_02905 [Candidatus Woykebacteria bacterium GWA1_44_8]|nr:MAG: hypothetical protein A2113_02905 [Candidatus Woykebacteria bacterium GWA1_44_8]